MNLSNVRLFHRLKRAYDAAGGRTTRLSRTKAVDTLRDVTRVPRELADRCLPTTADIDFETFCAAVAELAADAGIIHIQIITLIVFRVKGGMEGNISVLLCHTSLKQLVTRLVIAIKIISWLFITLQQLVVCSVPMWL